MAVDVERATSYAAFIFTKITKPIMSSLRLLGKRSSIYIDDLFNSHQEEVGCALQEKFIHGVGKLQSLRLAIGPTVSIMYVGWVVD